MPDFLQGVDPIVFRDPLRTVQYDSTQLNDPDFVGSFEFGSFVYFFFREAAVEHMNCGKAVFTRVARVCKNDPGFRQNSRSTWTSFFKVLSYLYFLLVCCFGFVFFWTISGSLSGPNSHYLNL